METRFRRRDQFEICSLPFVVDCCPLMTRVSHYLAVCFAACCVCFFIGCSNLVQVQGEVTLDGKALPNAKVMFMPKGGGRPAEGKSDADGKFKLTTNQPFDGAAPGEYTVTVTARTIEYQARAGTEEGFIEKPIWQAPERYSLPAKSDLVATVSAEKPQIKLELRTSVTP